MLCHCNSFNQFHIYKHLGYFQLPVLQTILQRTTLHKMYMSVYLFCFSPQDKLLEGNAKSKDALYAF